MKRRLFTLMITAFAFLHSAGQDLGLLNRLENGVLQVRQKAGTENLLSQYINKAEVKEDTVYAFIFAPSYCPRCESSIRIIRGWLHERGKKMMLISALEDRDAAAFYNHRKGYDCDYMLYDTDQSFAKIFSFNNFLLDGAYFLKLTRQGRLIFGTDDSETSEEVIDSVIRKTQPLDFHTFDPEDLEDVNKVALEKLETIKPMSAGHTDYQLQMPSDIRLGLLLRTPNFTDDLFFYPEEFFGAVPVFKKNGNGNMIFCNLLQPDSLEKTRYNGVSPKAYRIAEMNGMLSYIICNANLLGNEHIGISYSLPELVYEDNQIAYYNQPCILSRAIGSWEKDSITTIDCEVDKNDYFYEHFQFSSTGSQLILGCQKRTWPMSIEREEYENNVNLNSFNEAFYKTGNPYMAVFDRTTGNVVARFGDLDETAQTGLTGYCFVEPQSTVNKNEIAYTDSYSGKVHVCDTSNVSQEIACYTVFDLDKEQLQEAIDTTNFYKFEYAKPFNKIYYRKIDDVRITPDYVYCTVAYHKNTLSGNKEMEYTFVKVNRKSGQREELKFPQHDDAYVFGRGLRVDGDSVFPFEILKNSGKSWLRVYD